RRGGGVALFFFVPPFCRGRRWGDCEGAGGRRKAPPIGFYELSLGLESPFLRRPGELFGHYVAAGSLNWQISQHLAGGDGAVRVRVRLAEDFCSTGLTNCCGTSGGSGRSARCSAFALRVSLCVFFEGSVYSPHRARYYEC